jgi:aldehyde dehydrogenase (NAD+)
MATASSALSFAPSVVDHAQKFFIGGEWVDPSTSATLDVLNPATEEPIIAIALGAQEDVDRAVKAARKAFESFSTTTKEERITLLERVIESYEARMGDIANAISLEMGAPQGLAHGFQAPLGLWHFQQVLQALKDEPFEEKVGSSTVVYEPVGVVGMITPWNWPLNQISVKVGPALAAGCTMILKPSEIAPLSGLVVAEVLEAAGVPAGVFNLVNGDGPTVGAALASHPGIDMVSFTGSTRAGIEVARNAAPTVKRVAQELGGKSANVVLDDADLREVLSRDCAGVYVNSGQSCNAGARILVPEDRMEEAIEIAKEAAEATKVGDPSSEDTAIGPVVSQAQFEKVQRLIQSAIDEGATIVTGGTGRPEGLEHGYFVKPTVVANVTNEMTIAREEIFGPVLTLTAYRDEDEAVRIANDTAYGLSGYVSSADPERARKIARKLRTGMVHVNGAPLAVDVPFGGYRQSGNGREFAGWGLREYLEAKTIYGDNDA